MIPEEQAIIASFIQEHSGMDFDKAVALAALLIAQLTKGNFRILSYDDRDMS